MVSLRHVVVLVALSASGNALGWGMPNLSNLTSATSMLPNVVHHPFSRGDQEGEVGQSRGFFAKTKGFIPGMRASSGEDSQEGIFAKAKGLIPGMGTSSGEDSQEGIFAKAKGLIPGMGGDGNDGTGGLFAKAKGMVPGMPDLTGLTGPSGMLHKLTSPLGSFQEQFSDFAFLIKVKGYLTKVLKFLHVG